MLPSFDFQGGLPLTAARAGSDAALLSVFGTLVFRAVVGPHCFERMPAAITVRVKRRLVLLTQAGAGAYVALTLVWLVLQSADFASTVSPAPTFATQTFSALPKVVAGTEFGHLILLQLAAMLLVSLAAGCRDTRRRQYVALGFATAATALQSGHSHAASMYSGPSVLLASDILHLLAAGAWLGGLPPLLMVVLSAPPQTGATAARWFTPLGKLCVTIMAATALYQGWVLIASIPGLVGTAYGWMALVKVALFGILFIYALANRYRFAPALLGTAPHQARRVLLLSLATQSCFGLAIVIAAAGLSGLEPAMHAQPLWPFAQRLSLDAVSEDPDFRIEVIAAGLALAAAVAVLILGICVRRLRWPAIAIAAIVAWFAAPHLDLLFVPAEPTYYWISPSQFASASIVAGAALYPQNCAACHGPHGRGNGPAAASLPIPPADLTAAHLWAHPDGQLFWWLSHGIEGPEGGLVMPGFAASLSDDQRWALIDFIRANNAGVERNASGDWTRAVQAPGFDLTCTDPALTTLSDLHGQVIRIVFGPAQRISGAVTIAVDPAAAPLAGVCVTNDQAVQTAYAITAGLPTAGLPTTGLSSQQILVDARGWLRAVLPASVPLATLADTIHAIAAKPLVATLSGHAGMKM